MSKFFKHSSTKKPKRTNFDLSHTVVLSTDVGKLTPFLCQPVLPGDTFRIKTDFYSRFAPFLSPVMDRMNVYMHYFFVPNRLLWKEWRQFITGGVDGTLEPVYPRLVVESSKFFGSQLTLSSATAWNTYFGIGSLVDYLGFPITDSSSFLDEDGNIVVDEAGENLFSSLRYEYDLLPLLAYYRIWTDYYRDQNLTKMYSENGLEVDEFEPISSGVKTNAISAFNMPQNLITESLKLRYRAWEKDYFTSALPWAQRGGDVVIPGTQAGSPSIDPSQLSIAVKDGAGSVPLGSLNGNVTLDAPHLNTEQAFPTGYPSVPLEGVHSGGNVYMALNGGTSVSNMVNSIDGQLHSENGMQITAETLQNIVNELEVVKADVARSVTNTGGTVDEGTINNLRRANALQKYLEAMARGGSRYIEQIKSIFGVTSSDARLQRAEYLGGGKGNVIISEVLQQSADTTYNGEESPLGAFAGRGVAGTKTKGVKRFFEEHGWLIGIASIKPRSSYASQGMPRIYAKYDRYDYGNPYFANLGEQEIKNQELFYDANVNNPDINGDTFGYAPRFSEYKYIPNAVRGDMRNNLDFWTMSRKFSKTPKLNEEFVTVSPADADRIFAVDNKIPVESDLPLYPWENNNFQGSRKGFIFNDRIYCQFAVNIRAKRPLPKYGTPKL